MFRWYCNAEVCFVFLKDVDAVDNKPALERSEWFSRGWTLQELLAPRLVIFLTNQWQVIGHKGVRKGWEAVVQSGIGVSLDNVLVTITGIPASILHDYNQSRQLSDERQLKWR